MLDVYTDRLEHPYLFALLPITFVLLSLAVVVDGFGWDFGAGFLALFAMVTAIILVIGYGALYSLHFLMSGLRQWRINRKSGSRTSDGYS